MSYQIIPKPQSHSHIKARADSQTEAQANQKGIGLLTELENRQKSQTEGPDLGYVWLSLKGVLGNKSQALHSQLCDWRIENYGDVSW